MRRNEPIIYLDENDEEIAKEWVCGNKSQDLVTDNVLVHGFRHDYVVLFQENNSNCLDHYLCLRASKFLMVVMIPKKEFKKLCFININNTKGNFEFNL